MNKFLSMIENPRPETVIEEEKLIYFISKISIMDYLNIYESTINFIQSRKNLACSINIILNFMNSIMGQVIFFHNYSFLFLFGLFTGWNFLSVSSSVVYGIFLRLVKRFWTFF